MKHLSHVLFVCLCLLPALSWGQARIQVLASASDVCAGSVVSVSYTAPKSLMPGARLSVWVSSISPTALAITTSPPTSATSGTFTLTIPTGTPPGEISYSILSDRRGINDENISSEANRLTVRTIPSGQLLPYLRDNEPVSPKTAVPLSLTATGGAPYTFTLRDGTQWEKVADIAYPVLHVFPDKTTTYQLASVRNACGTAPATGNLTVRVSATEFAVFPPDIHCWDASNEVAFRSSAPLPANATLEAELLDTGNPNWSMPLVVRGNSSPVQIQLPTKPTYKPVGQFQYRLFSRQADVSARWTSRSGLFSPPELSVTGATQTTFGRPATLALTLTSENRWQFTMSSTRFTLSDGQVVSLRDGYTNTEQVAVQPTQTTTYSFVSADGTCAAHTRYSHKTWTVSVLPGIRFDSLSTYEACTGQPVTLFYTASPGWVLPSKVQVRLPGGAVTEAQPTRPGQLTFAFPATATASQFGGLQLITPPLGATLLESSQPFTLKVPPHFVFSKPTDTLSTGGDWLLRGQLTGGGRTSLSLNTGQRYAFVPAPQTTPTDVTLPVVAPASASTQLVVQKPGSASASLTIRTAEAFSFSGCPGSPFWVNLFPVGTFEADNQFQLFVADSAGTFGPLPVHSITATGTSSLSFAWPSVSGPLWVRVASTKPARQSNALLVHASRYVPPTATLQPRYPFTLPIDTATLYATRGVAVPFWLAVSGGKAPYVYTLTNGARGSVQGLTALTAQFDTSGWFGVRQLTDACGVSTQNATSLRVSTAAFGLITEPVSPYIVSAYGNVFNQPVVCTTLPAAIPFSTLGTLPAGLTYVVQASLDGRTWQSLPTSGTASPLQVRFPESMAGLWPYYRVGAIEPGGQRILAHNYERVFVSTTPKLTLSGPTPGYVDRYVITLRDTTAVNTTVLLSNGTDMEQLFIPALQYRQPYSVELTKPGTYSIVSAYNACGTGQTTGIVRFESRPTISYIRTDKGIYCGGDTIQLSYAVGGVAPGTNVMVYLSRYLGNTPATLITTTTSLTGTISIPTTRSTTASTYSLMLGLSSAPARYSSNLFTINQLPNLTVAQQTLSVATTSFGLSLTGTVGTSNYSLTLTTPDGEASLIGSSGYVYIHQGRAGTYTLRGASNECGLGQASGSIHVTVTPVVSLSLAAFLNSYRTGLPCDSRPVLIGSYRYRSRIWQPGNVFTVYVSDTTGVPLRPIPSWLDTNSSNLVATLPADLPIGVPLRFWVGASAPTVLEPVSQNGIPQTVLRAVPSALLTGSPSVVKGNEAIVNVALTGSSPWRFDLTGPTGSSTITTDYSPYTLRIRPDTTVSYRLTHVQNDCGSGPVSGTALITVLKLLTTEPGLTLELRTWPNPTAGTLQLEGVVPGAGAVQVRIYTLLGTLVQSQSVQPVGGRVRTQLDISALPTGTYLLTAEQDGRRSVFKVVKE
jgi:hypothetical protein